MLSAADYRHRLGEWDTLSARRGTPTTDTDGAQVLLVGGRFSTSVNNAGAASARYARSGVHGAGRTASAHTPRAGVRLDDVVRFTDRHHGGMASATGPDHRVGSPEEEERFSSGSGCAFVSASKYPTYRGGERRSEGDPAEPTRVPRGRDAGGVAVRGARAARGGAGRDGSSQEPGSEERQGGCIRAGGAAADRLARDPGSTRGAASSGLVPNRSAIRRNSASSSMGSAPARM
jgi:hypothetical protein